MGVIITKTWARRELFDSLNLPEEFLIRDYRRAIEEKGIKVSNSSILYRDMIIGMTHQIPELMEFIIRERKYTDTFNNISNIDKDYYKIISKMNKG